LGDVVAVAAGQRHRERDALAVGDEVVLAARACAVDRAGSAFGPRRAARTWEESITARDQSSWFFERSPRRARAEAHPLGQVTRKWCDRNTGGNREKKARFLANKRSSSSLAD
jgi:hypothetical protein